MKKNITGREPKIKGYAIKLTLFLIVFTTSLTLTHCQAQSLTPDSTKVAYTRLNEFAKFVEFKSKGDSLIAKLEKDISRLEVISKEKDTLLFNYEYKLIPNLNSQLSVQSQKLESKDQILAIREDYFKQERKRLRGGKLRWGVVGSIIGVVVGLFAF